MLPKVDCFRFYVGCETNEGKFVGFNQNSLFVESEVDKTIGIFEMSSLGISVFLYLRQLDDLTDEERNKLIEKGFNIGRPKGYSFSPEAFLYILSLHMDIFGLIRSGFAKEKK
jgi:hypothetical protein